MQDFREGDSRHLWWGPAGSRGIFSQKIFKIKVLWNQMDFQHSGTSIMFHYFYIWELRLNSLKSPRYVQGFINRPASFYLTYVGVLVNCCKWSDRVRIKKYSGNLWKHLTFLECSTTNCDKISTIYLKSNPRIWRNNIIEQLYSSLCYRHLETKIHLHSGVTCWI